MVTVIQMSPVEICLVRCSRGFSDWRLTLANAVLLAIALVYAIRNQIEKIERGVARMRLGAFRRIIDLDVEGLGGESVDPDVVATGLRCKKASHMHL